jgi:hypothetical protein
MLGVIWRDFATARPARPAAATASAAVVFASVTVRRGARAREITVSVTELSAVARNPTNRRFASGPKETGSARTGLYSGGAEAGVGAAAAQSLARKTRQQAKPAGANDPNLSIMNELRRLARRSPSGPQSARLIGMATRSTREWRNCELGPQCAANRGSGRRGLPSPPESGNRGRRHRPRMATGRCHDGALAK